MDRIELVKMHEVSKNFYTQQFTLQEVDRYMEKKGSIRVVVLDSAPYIFRTWYEYYNFKKK